MCVKLTDIETASQVKFISRLDERLKCPVCKNVFIEPWQTSCGHRFCKSCLEALLRHVPRPEIPRCPVDGEEIVRDEYFRDKCCEREVLNLECFCRYKKRSCDWRGEFGYLKAHEGICQYGDVQCQACDEMIERRHLEQHRTNDCINRAVICTYCGGEVQQSNIKNHSKICLKFPIGCILNCGQDGIPRDMMEEHVTTHCPKAEHPCPFSFHGCVFKGTTEKLNQHIKDNVEYHLEAMNHSNYEHSVKHKEMEEKVSRLENEKNALERQLQNQTEELVAARINIQTQQNKLSRIETSINDQQKHMDKLYRDLEVVGLRANEDVVSSQMEEILNTVKEHERKMNSLQTELTRLTLTPRVQNDPHGLQSNLSVSSHHACERRFDRTEHQLALHEIQLSEQDLQIQMLEATSYDGVYLWKIDHYSRRLQEAISGKTPSIYSPPFYVGRFGYKVCARLYPNGDGMGKGTHMSMFFVVMRGEYDALLPWPFIQKVHFKLLDQERIRDAYDAFRPDPQSSSFKKPTSDMNIASGCPTFISHTELQRGGYIRNDTMFVKITIDTSGLQGEIWR